MKTPDQIKRIEAMLQDTDGLRECPFCGGEARYEDCDGIIMGDIRWSIGCVLDEGGCCHGFQSLNTYATKTEARKAWNTRSHLEPLSALYEEYKLMRAENNTLSEELDRRDVEEGMVEDDLLKLRGENKRLREAANTVLENLREGDFISVTRLDALEKALKPPEET